MPPLLIVDISAFGVTTVLAVSLLMTVLGSGLKPLNLYFTLYALAVVAWAVLSMILRISLYFNAGDPFFLRELASLCTAVSSPFLLLFISRYVKEPGRWPSIVAVTGIIIIGLISYFLFTHRIVSNPRLLENGTSVYDLSPMGFVAAVFIAIPMLLANTQFWIHRDAIREPFIAVCALIVTIGYVLGGVFRVPFPIMSLTNAVGVGVLGFGVVKRQLFNPLKELTEELERKVAERTRELEQAQSEVEFTVEERTARLLEEIGQRRKAEDSLKERADRLELIASIAQKTTALIKLDELLQQSATLVRDTFEYSSAAIFLIDGEALVLSASTLPLDRGLIGKLRLKVGEEGVVGWVAGKGEPFLVADVTQEPRYVSFGNDHALTRAELAVPLKLRGKAIGVLNVESSQIGAFTPLDQFTLQTVADQLSNAIDSVRLYDQVARRAEKLALINRISAAVSAVLDLSDLMETVYREVTPIFQTDAFYIALYDAAAEELEFRIQVDEGVKESSYRRPIGEAGFTSWVIREKKPLLVNDIPGAMSWLPPPVVWGKGKIPFSWLAVPMMMGERPIGVISVQTYARRSYDADDLALLCTVAEQVAIAVENARLYEALRMELEERKRTEKGLRESEEQFRNLADQSPNMIFINKGGRVVYANKQCETTGYTRDHIYGPAFDFQEMTAPEYRDMVSQNFRRHIRGEEVAPYEYCLIRRDGRKLDAILTTKLIHHAGEPAILGIITDITARKRTERFLRSLNAAALAMAQALTPEGIFPAVANELIALDFTCAVLIADNSRTRLTLCYAGGKRIGEKPIVRGYSEQDDGWLSIEGASKAISTAVRERRTVHARFDAEGGISSSSFGIPPQWLSVGPGEPANVILSPLSVGEDVFGLLLVIGESLGTDDLPIIAAFAHQTAAAWRKTILMKDLEHSLEELRRTQDLLLHAQKMEAIGRLAGGIAHDFNNVLTVISGFTSLLADSLQENTAALGDLAEIKSAIKRASALTSRLLAFSRRQILQPEVLDLNTVLSGCAKLLRPLIGEDIDLVLQPAGELGRIKADRYQIEQVVINLAVNARDAMPSGGSLVIESANRRLSAEEAETLSVSPGDFVTLTVRDTGIGMSEDIMRHIFEPFFTTKEDGKGTGLGLSTVYGIVKQTGGAISVQSKPDKGSVFIIFIPCVAEESAPPLGDAGVEKTPEGTGTILLVEDDVTVRDLAGRILKRAGYVVLSASSGEEALEIASGEKTISLMVTDIVMPGMNGVALSRRIEELRPGLPILFMSGYTDEPSIHLGVPDGLPFITKPFQPNELLKKVAEVILPHAGEKA